MSYYLFHPVTGEYQGISELPVQYSTGKAPLEPQAGKAVVFDQGTVRWRYLDDFRGTEYWLADGSAHRIDYLGEALPEQALDTPPPPSFEALAEIERDWRDDELLISDRLMLADFPLTAAQREAISQYRAALRIGPNTDAAFPEQDWRPEWPNNCPRPKTRQ